ncbi:MAG: polysaccharide deacetylase family protein [Candidatus Sumerlaeota bacterium]|nr:polysaccharide deacetylase family protein [Candidatus Sumerlaeota bacterium]
MFTPGVRVINYHSTPKGFADQFEKQLRYYSKHYRPIDKQELDAFLEHRPLPSRRTGIILTFDDGLRDNFEVAAPLLEKYGFQGWFFVPTGFVNCRPELQEEYAKSASIHNFSSYPDKRISMSGEELRQLTVRHVVGCHSASHRLLSSDLTPGDLEAEICTAKSELECILQKEVDSFCWVGGEERSYSAAAANLIRKCGYRYAFMTNSSLVHPGTSLLQIQRTNIEASWPVEVVEFQLSGIVDLLYHRKKLRVNRMTGETFR